jgi:hypothetical protein
VRAAIDNPEDVEMMRDMIVQGSVRPEPPAASALRIPHAVPIVATTFLACFALLGVAWLASARYDRPFGDFTRDPATVLTETGCADGGCSIVGFVTKLGAIAWGASAAVALFAMLVLRFAASHPIRRSPYLSFGLLTLLLVLDESFLIHELGSSAALALNERVIFSGYALSAVAIFWSFRAFLARTSFWLLGLAVGLFGVSLIMDIFVHGNDAVEDGAKLLGIAAWAVFLIGTAAVEVSRAIDPAKVERAS